jgi:hypothetical protein
VEGEARRAADGTVGRRHDAAASAGQEERRLQEVRQERAAWVFFWS